MMIDTDLTVKEETIKMLKVKFGKERWRWSFLTWDKWINSMRDFGNVNLFFFNVYEQMMQLYCEVLTELM